MQTGEGMGLQSSVCRVSFASDASRHRGASHLPLRIPLGSVLTQPELGASDTPLAEHPRRLYGSRWRGRGDRSHPARDNKENVAFSLKDWQL